MPKLHGSRRHGKAALIAAVTLGSLAVLVPGQAATAAETLPDGYYRVNSVDSVPAALAGRQSPDHVLFWQRAMLQATREAGGIAGPITRGGALLNISVYDAVNSIYPVGKPYLSRSRELYGRYGALDSAIDYAAYTALKEAFPTVNLDDDLAAALALPSSASARDRELGKTQGTKIAKALIAHRANDGSADATPYVPNTAPGHWRPTTPGVAAGGPNWGKVKPWVIASGDMFRPAKPGGFETAEELLASDLYADELNEVKTLGAADSTVRTPEQTQIARFWANDVNGSYKPTGQQYDHTLVVLKKYKPKASSFYTAKLFGVLSVALADAAISAWDTKWNTDFDLWRPQTAIREAANDYNDKTAADPTWVPTSMDANGVHFSPPFPAYQSGHSTFGSTWAGIMKSWFGTDTMPYEGTTDDPNARGVTRHVSSFSAAAAENAISRLYNGVHYRFDTVAGVAGGQKVSAAVWNARPLG
ncbi:vanadium-dependent haloperoxidase [Streptomyces sp. NPDC007818]|uniref:vanadium-dependent haloperoxidase n=1 Tax=Streptomyces sp. NPDC007818 TaxID=3364780 RepID=UPI0036B0C67C